MYFSLGSLLHPYTLIPITATYDHRGRHCLCFAKRSALPRVKSTANLPAGTHTGPSDANAHVLAITPSHFAWSVNGERKRHCGEGRRGEMVLWLITQTESDPQDCLLHAERLAASFPQAVGRVLGKQALNQCWVLRAPTGLCPCITSDFLSCSSSCVDALSHESLSQYVWGGLNITAHLLHSKKILCLFIRLFPVGPETRAL